jgi:uncharacterized phage infection (PIP) family protein YhgE
MGRLHNQIDELKRGMEAEEHDLEILFTELGLLVCDLRQPFATGPCEQPYLQLAKTKTEHQDINARIDHLKQIGQQISRSASRISEVTDLIHTNEGLLSTVFSRIGVIAWEESASHVLPENLAHLLPDVTEQQKQIAHMQVQCTQAEQDILATNGVKKIPIYVKSYVLRRRLKRITDDSEFSFAESGRSIAAAGCIRQLASESAPALEEEYDRLSQEVAGYSEEITVLKQSISSSRDKLEKASVSGSVERTLLELKEMQKAASEKLGLHAGLYGKTICRLDDPWKDLEIPPEVLKCYDQIRRHERIHSQMEKRIGELRIEIDISELLLLIGQDEERIAHLHDTIAQFEHQIDEIRLTIQENRERISKLKQRDTLPLDNSMTRQEKR